MSRSVADAERRLDRRWLLGISAPNLLVFGRILGHDFVLWDDPLHVTENPLLSLLTPGNLLHFWRHSYEGLYIPASYMLFAAEAGFSRVLTGGLAAGLFHAVSLLLHLSSAVVVYLLLRRLFTNPNAAGCGALVFSLHPLQVESVAWISEQRGLLSGLLSLLAILLFVQSLRETSPDDEGDRAGSGPLSRRHFAVATAAFLLALLAKPTAVVLPLIAGALAIAVCQTPWRRVVVPLGVWLGLAILFAVGTKLLQPTARQPFSLSWGERLLVAGDALAFYMAKLVAPVSLGFDYGRNPARVLATTWSNFAWMVPLGGIGLLTLLRGRRIWLTAATIFIFGLLPVLGLVTFDYQRYSTVADRYVYLPLLALATAAAAFLARHPSRGWGTALVFVCCVWGMLSFVQAGTWANTVTLAEQTLRVNPRSYVAENLLGQELARQGKLPQAISRYRASLAIQPEFVEAHLNLGVALYSLGEREAALRHFRTALKLQPDNPAAHYNLANALADEGKFDEAIMEYRRALAVNPRFVDALHNLGITFAELGRHEEAIECYRQALAIAPESPQIHNNLGIALAQCGRFNEAEREFRAALALRPGDTEARRNLDLLRSLPR